MTNVLSTISQHFGKSLILGAFLPALVFVVAGLLIVVPLLPPDSALIRQAQSIENLDTKDLVVLSLITVVLSGLIHNLNIPLMRLYEGYPWRGSLLGMWLTRRYQNQFDSLKARQEGMRVVRDVLRSESKQQAAEFSARVDRISLRIANEFPSNRSSVLPTRFGNVIRSFEDGDSPTIRKLLTFTVQVSSNLMSFALLLSRGLSSVKAKDLSNMSMK